MYLCYQFHLNNKVLIVSRTLFTQSKNFSLIANNCFALIFCFKYLSVGRYKLNKKISLESHRKVSVNHAF